MVEEEPCEPTQGADPQPADEATPPPPVAEHPDLRTARALTIGMATYDDYDGVYFTVQAIRLYHPEVTRSTEILVLDNHPDGPAAAALRTLADHIPGYRYVPNQTITGTAVRDLIFREARTPYVMSVDCHVLFPPGVLRRLLEYFDRHPACRDLLQGPLVWDELTSVSTHLTPSWGGAMYGQWATDARGTDPDAAPFEIPMQGLGVFACRREAWLGFNPHFRGFGGEEGYIHEKFRQAGSRTLCLPFLRWVHRFGRPFGVPYPITIEDRVRNYLIGWTELGLETTPIEVYFREYLGEETFDPIYQEIRRELDPPARPVVGGQTAPPALPILRHRVGYQLEACDGELLLYHPEKTQAVYLNETAALVWQLCDGHRSVAEMRTLILDAYPDQAAQILDDLPAALQQLAACGAIESACVANGPAASSAAVLEACDRTEPA